jgi:transposase
MQKTYSADLRRRIVRFVETEHLRRKATRMFDGSPSFVNILMQHYRATGRIDVHQRCRFRHDSQSRHLESLVGWIEAEPGLMLAEMSRRLKEDHGALSSQSDLSKLLRRSGFTYKNPCWQGKPCGKRDIASIDRMRSGTIALSAKA